VIPLDGEASVNLAGWLWMLGWLVLTLAATWRAYQRYQTTRELGADSGTVRTAESTAQSMRTAALWHLWALLFIAALGVDPFQRFVSSPNILDGCLSGGLAFFAIVSFVQLWTLKPPSGGE